MNEVLRISVTDDGSARVVARNLENIGKAGDRATKSADILKKALVAVGAAATIRELVRMNDTVAALDSALRTNFGSVGKANAAMAELSEVAARTRSRLGEVVTTFDTLQDATERYNLDTPRLIGLTETWTKLFRIGGQSAGAAASSVQQLGASLASNDFSRGVQTLLRQNLDFASAIAKGYGTSVEELRNLAKDGRLTAESFIAATEQIRSAVDTNFGFVEGAIGDALGTLEDSTALLVRRFFETTDTGRTTVQVIEALAAGIRGLANDSARMESAGKSTVDFLADVYQRGRVVIRVLQEIGTTMLTVGQAAGSLGQVLNPAGLANVIASGRSPLAVLEEGFGPLREQIAAFPEFVRELERLSVARPAFPTLPAAAPAPSSGGGGGSTPDPMSLLAPGRSGLRELQEAARERERAIADFARLRGELDPLVEAGNRYAESLRVISEAATTGAFSQEQIASATAGVTAEFEKARNAASAEAVDAFRQVQETLNPAIAAGREYARTIAIIDAAARTGKVSQEEIAAAVQGATDAYQKARESLGAQGDILGAVAGQFDNALNSLVNFANTGKASIGEFAASAVSDLQRVFLKLLLVKSLEGLAGAFGGAGGGGLGGIFGSLAGLIGGARAEGGPVSPGKAFLVGEEGPELFVPPTRGNILANDALENGAGAKVPVQITNVFDPKAMVDTILTKEGEDAVITLIQRNQGRLRDLF